MYVQQRKRLKLITPSNIPGKVLKTCVRCRQHKTKCDASRTDPLPCSHCFKKNINCTLDIITKDPNRSNDLVTKLTVDVRSLKKSLDTLINRKFKMINMLVEKGVLNVGKMTATPPISKIEACLNSPLETPMPLTPESPKSDTSYTINSHISSRAFSISQEEAVESFHNYHLHFNRYLPIFPEEFFNTINIERFYQQNDLLFWSIILTSYLNQPEASKYLHLSNHIKSLVVGKCWFNTPRSVYILSSLLILTTWPLPSEKYLNNGESISIKYLSLMKNISLQLGLHRSQFIDEFSHKTEINVSDELKLNNLIRERIYKFININSNYCLIYSGLSHLNYNGFQQDYIINKANQDLFNNNIDNEEDKYINSLLKISLVQLKLNENMNDIINDKKVYAHANSDKLINLNMFEIILNDFNKDTSPLLSNNLIKLSVEFLKLQLFVYSFSRMDISLVEYRRCIMNAIKSCYLILDLFAKEFVDIKNVNQLPVHYKFIIELTSLIMLRIHSCPLLNTLDDYHVLKENFQKAYGILSLNNDKAWLSINGRLRKIIEKYDNLFREKPQSILNAADSFFLISKMQNYLVSSLNYEMVWYIYQDWKNEDNSEDGKTQGINWLKFGLNEKNVTSKEIMDYLSNECSIFK
ncbi:uncharacterized protein AC631_04822 [Debaryomyces fabryi]|uniref:Zn(2)-C6 fungal-type domain-containing protein n=1 Tax=Debaryomyces fabryi TaxID=58627 RepID=A0A0V1PTD1_9ASCO|nr:uncharacterized protein AC631_04822 [Debaryomyces fabryi]KRZ99410.1 hypothetical protein AC631_04822 [Debaryomyces fabryi]CUM46183.1 unnamed protein product [Debaryomyces fabryi]